MSATGYIGQRFGTRVCVGQQKTKTHTEVKLLCDCGKEVTCSPSYARKHGCRSCAKKHHGHRPAGNSSPEYNTWRKMKYRCLDPKCQAYARYGGSGITICDRWMVFENFLEDMGPRPDGCTLDRVDSTKGYGKDNCRWATWTQQNRNKRSSRIIEYKGISRCISEWAELTGLTHNAISYRIRKGWPLEKVFTHPLRYQKD